jgi:probable HAF family extracellular repeat protein
MRYIVLAVLIAAAVGCDNETEGPRALGPDAQLPAVTVSYNVVKHPASLGGTQSRGMAINDQELVAGWSNRADGTRHAAIWRDGAITDLGTLGGAGFSSTVQWPGLNNSGVVVGITHTTQVDPLDEDWSCEFGGFLPQTTNRICRGFVWEHGVMRQLPTLGGNHGFAAGVNNLGQIVGWAETTVEDPTCAEVDVRQFLQFRAVLWEPKKGSDGNIKTRELPPLPGDSTSAATAINDNGQAVGISGDCDQAVGRFSALHAILWDKNGKPTELPNLGGTTWHTPMDINQQGDVVGFSNPPGAGDPEGAFIAHAFLWVNGSAVAKDLRTLDDDALSQAFAINSRRQVVGVSFGGSAGIARAFLWQNDVLTDLNDLVDIAPDVLLSAQDINEAGQITGRVRDGVTGEVLMFVATPITGNP